MKFELIVYWKDKERIALRAKIKNMDVQGDNIFFNTIDEGFIVINAKLIAYLQAYPLKDGK